MARQRVSLYRLAQANVRLDSIAWHVPLHIVLSLVDAAKAHTALKALVSLIVQCRAPLALTTQTKARVDTQQNMNASLVLRVASASRVTPQIQRPIHLKFARKAITVKRAREPKMVRIVRQAHTSQSKVAIDA